MAFTDISHEDAKAKALVLVSGGGAHSMEDLQFAGNTAEGGTAFNAGALVCLNSSGDIVPGLALATSMPMFAINGSADYDAGQYAYNMIKAVGNLDGTRQGDAVVNCLVASGGYEIQTTEYNITDYTEANYTKGSKLLHEDTVTAGTVKPATTTYSDATVVGCVSVGIESSTDPTGLNRARIRHSQTKLLRFWTLFIPPVNAT